MEITNRTSYICGVRVRVYGHVHVRVRVHVCGHGDGGHGGRVVRGGGYVRTKDAF